MEIGTTHNNSPFKIQDDARARHIHIVGQTGTGKSVLLENMIAQMIKGGEGFCFIDPHGQSARTLIGQILPERKDDLIFINLADEKAAPGLNFLTDIPIHERPLAAANIVAAFKHVYADSWGPRMEYVFLCAVRSLMDSNLTLLALPRLFVDPVFRAKVVRSVKDSYIKNISWYKQFPEWQKRFGPELTGPIDNKVGTVLAYLKWTPDLGPAVKV